ncbi:unnamed protein product [Agarophyton chilense]
MSGPHQTAPTIRKRLFNFCACFGDPDPAEAIPETVYVIPPTNNGKPSAPQDPVRNQPQGRIGEEANSPRSNIDAGSPPLQTHALRPNINPTNFKTTDRHSAAQDVDTIQSENKAPHTNQQNTEYVEHDRSKKPQSIKVMDHSVHSELSTSM